MKLIAVLGIEEYKNQINKVFAENGIPIFSEVKIKGFQNQDKTLNTAASWFSDHDEYVYSVANFAFVADESAGKILNKIQELNQKNIFERPLHAFQLDVEKFV